MRAQRVLPVAAVAVGGGVVTGLWMLFERVQRPTLEVKSYVESIHGASEGWVRNTEELMTELRRMPERVAELPELAGRYAETVGRS